MISESLFLELTGFAFLLYWVYRKGDTVFRFPNSDATVSVGWKDVLKTSLFGVFFFFYKGLWKHALLWSAYNLCVLAFATVPLWKHIPFLGVHFLFAFFTPRILKHRYREKGYREIPKRIEAVK